MADIIETIRVPIRDRSIRVGPFVFGVVALDGIVQSTTLGVGCAWFSRVLTICPGAVFGVDQPTITVSRCESVGL